MNKPHPFAPGVIDAGEPGHNCNCWAYAIAMTLTTVALTIFVVGAYAGYMSEQAPSPAEQCAAQRFAAKGNQAQLGERRFTCTLNHDR